MMNDSLVMLARDQKNVATFLYILGYPALKLNDDQSLTPVVSQLTSGKVTKITLNSTGKLYAIHFSVGQKLQLSPKNVLRVATNPDNLAVPELLTHYGYRLNLPTLPQDFQDNFQQIFPSMKHIENNSQPLHCCRLRVWPIF